MSPNDLTIALRIRHPSADPNEITRHLGFEPDHAWRAGDLRERDDDDLGPFTRRETYWVGVLPRRHPVEADTASLAAYLAAEFMKSRSLSAQTDLFFVLLRMKRAKSFWRSFVEQGGTIECLLQIHEKERFHLDLEPALLLALVELKIALSLEVDLGLRAAA